MADEQQMYGYESDEVVVSPFNFGLNPGKAFLTKFEWIPNGGKDGAEQEALEIIFNINGKDKSYRRFPIVKAFGKNNEEITDPTAPEFKEAVKDFNAIITHIAHAFMDNDTYKAGMSRPITSFKQFCETVKSLLPRDTPTRALDIFMQYQWQPSTGQNRTFLDIPTKMKNGAWLKPAQAGTWDEIVIENPKDNDIALRYGKRETAIKDAEGKIVEYTEFHPIWKNGWFMKSNYAHKQGEDSTSSTTTQTTNVASSLNAAAAEQNAEHKPAATW